MALELTNKINVLIEKTTWWANALNAVHQYYAYGALFYTLNPVYDMQPVIKHMLETNVFNDMQLFKFEIQLKEVDKRINEIIAIYKDRVTTPQPQH